ncbi:MAG: YidC/Oxa1 family membrane protein insertase [Hominisplanchenecus sp.]|nr:YidC/Oxa1 family membrane protein insertase [Hominisplanchenecus sp.]
MLLTKSNTIIIGQVATILGLLMNAIFTFTNGVFGIQNIGICIILFTLIIYALLTPITIKQQKFSKMSAVMNPELQAINKKYRNKKDQVSMMKMNEETQAVYEKYGVSPMGTCLPLLIQMPILFALYRVIWNIPAYVASVKDAFLPLVNALLKINGSQEFLAEIVGSQVNFDKLGYTVNSAVDALYKFKPANWTALAEQFPELSNLIAQTTSELDKMNYFLGLNISNSPMSAIIENFKTHNWLLLISALMIPVLAGLSQWINVKLMPQANDNSAADEENAMASSMKMMNNMMPLMSVFFCLSLPIGLGIYWIAGAVFRSIQQLIVNKHMEKMDVDELVRKNMEKVNEKRKKQGLPPKKISTHAKVNLKDIETEKAADEKREEKRKKSIQDSTEYYKNADVKPGSIAAKARMVQQFDDKKKKK